MKGRFFGKQRHDDPSEEPDRIALQRLGEAVAQDGAIAVVFHEGVELAERLHASALEALGPSARVARLSGLKLHTLRAEIKRPGEMRDQAADCTGQGRFKWFAIHFVHCRRILRQPLPAAVSFPA